MAKVVKCLPSNYEALSSVPTTNKATKKQTKLPKYLLMEKAHMITPNLNFLFVISSLS
jgi:hypothetical protein